jgi:hypothetical protein
MWLVEKFNFTSLVCFVFLSEGAALLQLQGWGGPGVSLPLVQPHVATGVTAWNFGSFVDSAEQIACFFLVATSSLQFRAVIIPLSAFHLQGVD